MARLLWLPDVLRAEGLTVVEVDGWESRGVDRLVVNGVVWHHTGTAAASRDEAVAGVLRDGRSDLPGPLAQLGLDRAGRFWVVASGRCNHNGFGLWGNDSIGIEAFNAGDGEPWPAVQIDAFQRGTAAICRRLGLDPGSQVKGHKETDPKRKTDPVGIDMAAARAWVRTLTLNPTPHAPTEEDDMPQPPATLWDSEGQFWKVWTDPDDKIVKADIWHPVSGLGASFVVGGNTGQALGQPSVAMSAEGRIDVTVVGLNGYVYQTTRAGGPGKWAWSNWARLGLKVA